MAIFQFLYLVAVAYVAAQNCSTYCATIPTVCTGANTQFYTDPAVAGCLDICTNVYPKTGNPGDASGNTFQCRDYHLGLAASLPNVHCVHAGPTGGGTCGSEVDYFCNLTAVACTGSNLIYPNYPWCVAEFTVFPTDSSANLSATPNTIDSSACRLYHASYAKSSPANAIVHCPHASPDGAGVCGVACDNYCDAIMDYCVGSLAQFSTRATCLSQCNLYKNVKYDVNNPTTSGDSLQCRNYHAILAGTVSATVHCPHAGPLGGGVCVAAGNAAGLIQANWILIGVLFLFGVRK